MSTFAEFINKKRQKKNNSFSDYTNKKFGNRQSDILTFKKTGSFTDIGPVQSDKDDSWFKKSDYFDDGYQAGDLLKTIGASLTDIGGNAGAGAIGMGESLTDTLLSVAAILNEGQANKEAANMMMYNVATGKEVDGVYDAYQTMQDTTKKEAEEFVKKDLYDEEAIANKIITAPLEDLMNVDAETGSVFGEKSDALAQSAGQLAATSALSLAGVPWWLTTGVTTFGSESENALNQGATLEEATISGLISAGAEILTEKISGGIKFGGKTLDDALTKRLAANVSNKALQTLFKFGIDAVGEGREEVLSGVMSAIGQKLTYADDKELNELFSSEDAWDSFIGGAVLGGFSNVKQNRKASRKGYDALSGLTTNEQAVFDKVYKETIAERENNGEKLTAKEKTKIYDDVLNKLEKGYISTDTIESVLGGDTYNQYQAEVDKEKALQDEFNTLNKMKQGDMTGEQVDRRNELKEQLKQIKESTTISDLKSKLSTEVSELAKSSRLIESYNEKSRKSQKFEADLSQYDVKQQSAVKRAIDSGVLNNSNRTHEFVDLIAKLEADKGVLFDFTNNEKLKESGFAVDGKEVAGYVQGKNIGVNIDSSKALNTVVGHEITHILEGTELYPALQDVVKVYAEAKGTYNSKLQSITKLYDGIEDANIENELTAELVGEYLFSDTDFINNLSAEQPGLFKKIYDEVKYLCKVATARSKEARQLEKVKKAFEDAYKQKNNTVADNGVKYSIEKRADGKQYVKADRQVFSGDNPKRWGEQVTNYINDTIRNGKDVVVYAQDGDALTITENTAGKAAFRNDVKLQDGTSRPMTDEEYAVKLRAESHIDEISQVSRRGNKIVPDYKNHNFAKDGFNYRTAYFMDADGKYYRLTLSVGKNGVINTVYNVGKIKEEGKYSLRGSKPVTDESVTMRSSSSDNSISNSAENVKENDTKFSLVDGSTDIAPEMNNNIYGEDIKLQQADNDLVIDDDVPIKQTPSAETTNSQNKPDIDIPDLFVKPKNVESGQTAVSNNIAPVEQSAETIDEKAVTRLTGKVIDGLGIGKTKKNRTAIGEVVKFLGDNYSTTSKDVLYDTVKDKFGNTYVDSVIKNATDLIYENVKEHREATSKIDKDTKDNIESANISDKVKKEIKNQLSSAYEMIEAEFNIDKKNLVNELNERRRNLEISTADKNTFFKKHSKELYNELSGLKKGVRASEDLAYFLDLGFNWNELKSTLLKVGKWPDTVLNSESEIETVVRDFLDQKYDDSVQELNDFDWMMDEEISKLEKKAEDKRYNAELAVNGKLVREIMDAEQVALIGDTSTWKDKKYGWMYKTETEQRNWRDIVKDKNGNANIKLADKIHDYFGGTYNHNEADKKRETAKIRKPFADLKLNKYEDVFVQMKGEFLHNPDSELTQHDIDTFLKLHGKKINESKVDNAIDMAREVYDMLIERMNEVLVAHGMKPIEYRKGYFPHFSEVKQGKIAKLLNWKTQNNDIPTDIAGITESFKPNRSWQSFNKQRISDTTDYSFLKGFDSYLDGSLDWIYHIDDIMKRRVFENRIRYDHSDKGIQDKINEIYQNNQLDTNAKQEQIDLVFNEAKNPLNNFIIDFRTRTNTLAGKKSSMDRGMEEFSNRTIYSTVTNLSNRVTANMVAGSISAALTNFIPITQSWAVVSPESSLRAIRETMKATLEDDGVVDKSDFLTNRLRNPDNLYQTGWDKTNKVLGMFMEACDSFTSQTVWRSKYMENIEAGMSEAEAIKNADSFAEGLLGGRSRGNMPTIFDSKNPIFKTFTAFQLEVNNQYRYMFKDVPLEYKNKAKSNLVKGYATMFIGANIYNAVYSALTGRDAAFDPIGIITDLFNDLGWLGDDEEEEPADIIMNLTDNIIDELPFVSGVLGDGGRVPLTSALPYGGIREAYEGIVTDFTEGNWKNLFEELAFSTGAYVVAPMGGGQLKKTIQGLSMFDDDLPIAGSYTDSGNLRFTVDETMGEMIRAGLFGQYANKNARDYFDNERAPLKEKQIEELIELDIPIQDYWEYREGLSELGQHATLNEKGDYIGNLDLPVEKKNILINNIADRDEPIDLTDFDKYQDFEEFDFATRYPEKYAVLQEQGISVKEYKEKYEETAFMYTDDFSWAANNPEKYLLSKAVTDDVMMYKKYTSDLSAIKADRDSNDKPISGSAKDKKLEYINSLDIEFGAKLILFKSQFKSDNRYNYEIIDYLNNRDDISRDEMITILEELDFTVDEDGNITWD